MSFTYDVTTDRGKVRLLIGDTDSTHAQFADAEIDFFLTRGSVYPAARLAAQALAAKYSRLVDQSVGDVRASYSQRFDHYKQLATDLAATAGDAGVPLPFAGGTSLGDKEVTLEDEDRNAGSFAVGMHDNGAQRYVGNTEDEEDS